MILFRETGWSYDDVMNMPISEVHYWAVEAVKLLKKLGH